MRLSPTVLATLAGTALGASLTACGGSAPRAETPTPEPLATAPAPVVTRAPPPTNGGPLISPESEEYPVDCGRG